jgi:hypothetical protein
MFVGSDFTFDQISGEEMFGLKLIRTEFSLDQPFGLSRKPVTDRAKNRSRVYHYGWNNEVLSFSLKFFKESEWDYEQRVAISKWLIQSKYCDFQSMDYPLVFKVVAVAQPVFRNLGNNIGYLEIEYESDSPFCYSPVAIAEYDLSDNTSGGTVLDLYNKSNVFSTYKPELEFEIISGDTVRLENLSNQGKVFELTGLEQGEKIYIGNETGRIISTASETRLSNLLNHVFFEMVYGLNRVLLKGNVRMEIRTQFPMMI